jgi:hypothetical protein
LHVQKNGRFVLLIGLGIALAIGLGVWLSGPSDSHDDGPPRIADGRHERRASHDSIGFGPEDSSERSARVRPRRVLEDGGVAPTGLPIRANRTRPPVGAPDLPRNARAAEETAGWRLGQARHHISIIEPRIAAMEQLVRDFEARGDTAAAERQRTILQRFQNRLTELREDEVQLEADARNDGSLADVDRGYEEGADERQRDRPPAREGSAPSGGGQIRHESSAVRGGM